jgi:protein-tyrosine phosphatase
MTAKYDVSVLFVCLGNICRSPLGEGVLAHHLDEADLSDRVRVDSAGTGAWHQGEPPDPRSTAVAMRNGISLRGRARRVRAEDFHEFDYIFAMDDSNLRDLRHVESQADGGALLTLFREFDPHRDGDLDVPDPYYGGVDGFDLMFEMIDRTCAAFIEHLVSEFAT